MKIGIIGAMEIEVDTLKNDAIVTKTIKKARMEFCEAKFADLDIVIVRSGVAKVNAALCVQILVDEFQVTHIINTGVAGSLDNRIDIGDLVVSDDACYHDVDATIFGYDLGEVPQLGQLNFEADSMLRDKAVEAVREAAPDQQVFVGRVCSGDQFICDHAVKDKIIKEFHPLCVEMEGAAIAQACWLNQIPFVIIRAISDKADGSAVEDYPTFESKAARDCAALVEHVLRHLA